VGRKLRVGIYDTALVLPNSTRSALEIFCGGVKQRIGYGAGLRKLLLTHPVRQRPEHRSMRKRTPEQVRVLVSRRAPPPRADADFVPASHQLNDYLHLAGALGASPAPCAPNLAVTPAEIDAALRRLIPPHRAGTTLVGINPGAEYGPAKRWPLDRFAAVARNLAGARATTVLVFGGKSDEPLAAALVEKAAPNVIPLAGLTSLRELMALLASCRVLVSNDTGPAHLAAALGTAVVIPFGSTSAALTGPGLPGDERHRFLRAQVPCAPCYLRECPIDFRCMQEITVDQVLAAVSSLTPVSRP
jgi:heptosyltransferase-2